MTYELNEAAFNYLKIEDIAVGQKFHLSHALTAQDIQDFAKLTGDFNPLHIDPKFAQRTSFRKPVVHGMLTASFISTMIGMIIPGPGALWTSQTLEFLNPAFEGDTINVQAVVSARSTSTRMIALEISIVNQSGTQLVAGNSVVRIVEFEIQNEKGTDMLKDVYQTPDPKVVLITGGSRGIGAATAALFAAKGHTVVINYLHAVEQANDLVQKILANGGRAKAIQGDISNKEQVEAMFAQTERELGNIQMVVHCAAPVPVPQAFSALDWETVEEHIATQIRGAFYCAKRALPNMVAASEGAFVFLSSVFAENVPPAQQTAYVTVKAGLAAMARSLAVEYGPKGIRFNIVAPGMTNTDMIANLPEKVKMLGKMNTPLRRLADSEDVAATIDFLMSPAARHITGETIRVCGGIAM
jgi:3-oxoacyl-[acyl-carrier protein] reductase